MLTERELQDAVTGMCRLYGIAFYHPYLSQRSAPGWPDLVLCGGRGFMARELKSSAGKTTTAQERWGHALRQAGVSWDIWRPDDLKSGRIQRELLEIR
jgi:hypothetical protein